MFVYNYRVYDRYRRPVASLALLTDDSTGWRPSSFSYSLLGCRMKIDFPVVKLLDFADRIDELQGEANPFALVTVAHLLARQTRGSAHRRRIAEWKLTRSLYERDWGKQRIIDLYRVVDWIMRLPEALELRIERGILQMESRDAMAYMSSFERVTLELGQQEGRQEGRHEGLRDVLAALLAKRFGELDLSVRERLSAADPSTLSSWALNFVDATTLDEVFHNK